MIAIAMRNAGQGLIERPYLFSFVLGQVGAIPATAKNLLHLAESIPAGSIWGVLGHGGQDLWVSSMKILMGGRTRAGFEDNVLSRPGEPAKCNAQLIKRQVRIAKEVGRPIASVGETRELLGLSEQE